MGLYKCGMGVEPSSQRASSFRQSMCWYSGILWLPTGHMRNRHMDYLRRSSSSSQKPLCQSAEPWCPAASSCCMRASSCSFSISGKACELLPDTSEGPVSNAAACSSCREVLKASQLYVKLPQREAASLSGRLCRLHPGKNHTVICSPSKKE